MRALSSLIFTLFTLIELNCLKLSLKFHLKNSTKCVQKSRYLWSLECDSIDCYQIWKVLFILYKHWISGSAKFINSFPFSIHHTVRARIQLITEMFSSECGPTIKPICPSFFSKSVLCRIFVYGFSTSLRLHNINMYIWILRRPLKMACNAYTDHIIRAHAVHFVSVYVCSLFRFVLFCFCFASFTFSVFRLMHSISGK